MKNLKDVKANGYHQFFDEEKALSGYIDARSNGDIAFCTGGKELMLSREKAKELYFALKIIYDKNNERN